MHDIYIWNHIETLGYHNLASEHKRKTVTTQKAYLFATDNFYRKQSLFSNWRHALPTQYFEYLAANQARRGEMVLKIISVEISS